jgi:hypothetical protein
MPLPADTAWFPAKRYGWGWGLPSRREGWLVIAAFLLAHVLLALLTRRNPAAFVAGIIALSTSLIAVCWWKGEAPRWRWGNDE